MSMTLVQYKILLQSTTIKNETKFFPFAKMGETDNL